MTKPKKVKIKAVAKVGKKDEKKKEIWTGAQKLMGVVQPGSKEEKERAMVGMVSSVLEVSPFGVNILGGSVYINKLGLGQKSYEYSTGKDEFKYNWVQRAVDETQKAICECKIVRNGKDITDWVTGECSPKTIKMGTLAGYQNHMAQTRAKNRAISEAYGVRIHADMIAAIGKKLREKALTATQAATLTSVAGKASSSSIEEVQQEKGEKSEPLPNGLYQYDTSEAQAPTRALQPPFEDHVCMERGCGADLTNAEAAFSRKVYGRELCREHQKTAKRK